MPIEAIFAILVVVLLLGIPLSALVLAIMAFSRVRRVDRLSRRVEELEAAVRGLGVLAPPAPVAEERPVAVEVIAEPEPSPAAPVQAPASPPEPIQWELLIGRKALGWTAVVVLVFAVAFLLRYAFQNRWIGPLGLVAAGETLGLALMLGGWHYCRHGWRLFSQMLSSAGVIVLYLATYAAFGFYHLLPRQMAGFFLALIVFESAILAVEYDSLAVALMAVVGGLLTPVLLHSDQDQYQALFTYLALLNAGVLLLLLVRAWAAIGSVALLGTQALFWTWYAGNYHPEKLAWVLGFQAVVFAIYLAHSLGIHVRRPRRASWEDLARMVLNPVFWFVAVYVLLRKDYGDWMGTAAVAMAALYAAVAWLMLALRPKDQRPLLTALAVAVGFIALAFPLEAKAAWIALGWAAEAAVLWWFGLRIESRVLRALAGTVAALAVVRLLFVDMPFHPREPFVPIFNEFALPALGVTACLLAAVAVSRPWLHRLAEEEQRIVSAVGLGGILLVWLVLSVDVYSYFDAWARGDPANFQRWAWLGQMSLSILWAVFATAVLAVGFRRRLAGLRWLALGLYALTVGKVFFVDMAELREIYRILAFFVLAVFLGLAARAYQRLRLEERPLAGLPEGTDHDHG